MYVCVCRYVCVRLEVKYTCTFKIYMCIHAFLYVYMCLCVKYTFVVYRIYVLLLFSSQCISVCGKGRIMMSKAWTLLNDMVYNCKYCQYMCNSFRIIALYILITIATTKHTLRRQTINQCPWASRDR